MGFHSQDDLFKLGNDVSTAAADAIKKEQGSSPQIVAGMTGGAVVPNQMDIFSSYAYFPELYAGYATPDPAGMQSALDTLAKTSFMLTHTFPGSGASSGVPAPSKDVIGGLDKNDTPVTIMKDVKDDIAHWRGSAKTAFEQSVLNNFSEVSQNQNAAISTLGASLSAQMILRQKLNDDIWTIGQNSITAFKKIQSSSNMGNDLQVVLAVAGAAVTAVGIWETAAAAFAEGGLAGGLDSITGSSVNSMVSALNNVGKSTDTATKFDLDQAKTADVISTMKAALAAAGTWYQNQQAPLITAMNNLHDGLTQHNVLFELTAPANVSALATDQLGDTSDANDPSKPTLRAQFSPDATS